MIKNTIRIQKINKIIKRTIYEIINENTNKSKTNIITITDVITSKDCSTSKIFISALNDNDTIVKNLNNSSKKLRENLSKKIHLYKTPKLIFINDEKLKTIEIIENIIKNIK